MSCSSFCVLQAKGSGHAAAAAGLPPGGEVDVAAVLAGRRVGGGHAGVVGVHQAAAAGQPAEEGVQGVQGVHPQRQELPVAQEGGQPLGALLLGFRKEMPFSKITNEKRFFLIK